MENNQEKEGISKFPVNKASVAGLVVREVFNDEKNRANITVLVADSNTPKYINVLISGKEKYPEFKAQFESSLQELGEQDGKQIKPAIHVSGNAFFSSNKTEKATHQNVSIIATGDLKDKTEDYWLTKNQEELNDFRKEFHQNNPRINEIEIRGNVASSEVKGIDGKNGKFHTFSIAHNYIKSDESQAVMYANVIVGNKQTVQLSQAKVEKGSPLLLKGSISPYSYENKNGDKVHSFNLITRTIHPDLSKSTSVKKAAEEIDKVAQTTKKADRIQQAEKSKETIGMKPSEKGM